MTQAAEHLGIPPGTVKSRAFYAVRALRKALEDRGVPVGSANTHFPGWAEAPPAQRTQRDRGGEQEEKPCTGNAPDAVA
ncbi:hypothetical protein [Streptomyces sp. AC512_CC834]|uniref:hypothetical protein n=1 Tax=Streptomyces sp. AC512_CC834 TaxID=2823691 RepID=UPI0020B6FE4D|nr:hypothetical protein [Streptomyces sp. AC512_CC834]